MCKLLFFSKISGLKINENLKDILEIMAIGNQDGIGLFSESGIIKSLDIDSIFVDKKTKNKFNFLDFNEVLIQGNIFNGNSLCVHSRTSTNYIGLDYCHPFTADNVTMAHNGVVTIEKNNYPLKTKNDSEYLTHFFNEFGLDGLENILGYYAIMAYDSTNNTWTIGRDDQATLFVGKIIDNDSFIVSTKKDDITKIAKILGVKLKFLKSLKDYSFFKVSENKIIESGKINKKTRTAVKDSLFYKSMAFEENYSFNDSLNGLDTYEDNINYYDIGFEYGLDDSYNGTEFNRYLYDHEEYQIGYLEAHQSTKISKIR